MRRLRGRRWCGIYPYGLLSYLSFLDGGGFTLSPRNVPFAGRWSASMSITPAADMRSRMHAQYTRGLDFPYIMPPRPSAQARRVKSTSIPARMNINASSCPVPCLKNNEGSQSYAKCKEWLC